MGVIVLASAWKWTVNFLVIPMDSFQAILGFEWADSYLVTQFGKGIDKVLLEDAQQESSSIYINPGLEQATNIRKRDPKCSFVVAK